MRTSLSKLIPILLYALLPTTNASFGIDPQVGLADLPPEVAKVFAETLAPNLGLCESTDLDGDGIEEVVLFSGSPLFPEGTRSDSMTISFQSLLMVFRKGAEGAEGFPYSLSAVKSRISGTPNPVHVTLADLGASPTPEIVWMEGGPDAKGRYSEAIVYSYRGDQNPSLVESARFSNSAGWVRVHDLDRDGVSETIAFSESDGGTICSDLLFFQVDRWTSLRAEIQALGFPDIAAFQTRLGMDPDSRVTRNLLLRYKSFRATGEVPAPSPPSEDALGPLYE